MFDDILYGFEEEYFNTTSINDNNTSIMADDPLTFPAEDFNSSWNIFGENLTNIFGDNVTNASGIFDQNATGAGWDADLDLLKKAIIPMTVGQKAFVVSANAIIAIITTLVNVPVLVVWLAGSREHSPSSAIVFNLLIFDLSVAGALYLRVGVLLSARMASNQFACLAHFGFLIYGGVGMQVALTIAIVDRYVAVAHPFRYQDIVNYKVVMLVGLCTHVYVGCVSFVALIPSANSWEIGRNCTFNLVLTHAHIYTILCSLLLCMFVSLSLYARVLIIARRHLRKIAGTAMPSSEMTQDRHSQLQRPQDALTSCTSVVLSTQAKADATVGESTKSDTLQMDAKDDSESEGMPEDEVEKSNVSDTQTDEKPSSPRMENGHSVLQSGGSRSRQRIFSGDQDDTQTHQAESEGWKDRAERDSAFDRPLYACDGLRADGDSSSIHSNFILNYRLSPSVESSLEYTQERADTPTGRKLGDLEGNKEVVMNDINRKSETPVCGNNSWLARVFQGSDLHNAYIEDTGGTNDVSSKSRIQQTYDNRQSTGTSIAPHRVTTTRLEESVNDHSHSLRFLRILSDDEPRHSTGISSQPRVKDETADAPKLGGFSRTRIFPSSRSLHCKQKCALRFSEAFAPDSTARNAYATENRVETAAAVADGRAKGDNSLSSAGHSVPGLWFERADRPGADFTQTPRATAAVRFNSHVESAGTRKTKLRQSGLANLLFCCCWFPFVVVQFYMLNNDPRMNLMPNNIASFLCMLNAILNPFIYVLGNKRMRRNIVNFLRGRRNSDTE